MTSLLRTETTFNSVSPVWEMGAYEALWDRAKASFKALAETFRESPGALPSDFVEPVEIERYKQQVLSIFDQAGVGRFGVRVYG